MMASASENPNRAVRITDCGLPPTPIHAGNGPDSRCGTTSWLSSGVPSARLSRSPNVSSPKV
jgi:hypothetical protein